jgi:hypothetical protein
MQIWMIISKLVLQAEYLAPRVLKSVVRDAQVGIEASGSTPTLLARLDVLFGANRQFELLIDEFDRAVGERSTVSVPHLNILKLCSSARRSPRRVWRPRAIFSASRRAAITPRSVPASPLPGESDFLFITSCFFQ